MSASRTREGIGNHSAHLRDRPVDAGVLADFVRRGLVPEVWVPLGCRTREPRAGLPAVAPDPLRTSAVNRTFGVVTQWGLRRNLTTLRKPGAIDEFAERGVPAVWRQSSITARRDRDLDGQLRPLERELRPVARADERRLAAD